MIRKSTAMVAFAIALGAAMPASAVPAAPVAPVTTTSVPEPADFALFLLGVAGLVVGRRTSRAKRTRAKP
jgi:hypothetical protein